MVYNYVDANLKHFTALMYADDLILISDTVGHLRNLISRLSHFCKYWGLSINMDKTKVMTFRNGGPLRSNEQWYFNDVTLENVTYYKYLGLLVSNRLVWTKAQQTLAAQANKTVSFILKSTKSVNFVNTEMLWTLFDHMVLPILTYGSQIWGCDTVKCIEQVQDKYCKYLLKLPNQAVNVAVRGECGRLPVKVTATLYVLKYWCTLLYMDNNRLPKSCYKMIHALDASGRVTWATKVKNLMYKSGFGVVWLFQEMGNVSLFLIEAKQRLIDIASQEWHSDLSQSSKLQTLCEFKSLLNPERYLTHVKL
jgi:hypothetical protein